MLPTIIEYSNRGYERIDIPSKLLKERKIFLLGDIDMYSADEFIMQFNYLENEGKEDINIYINGECKNLEAALVIYDLIQGSKVNVNLFCVGEAKDSASLIFVSGKKGNRFMLKHSKIKIKNNYHAGFNNEKKKSDEEYEEEEIKVIFSKHTGKSEKEISDIFSEIKNITPEKAIEYNMCDKIIERI